MLLEPHSSFQFQYRLLTMITFSEIAVYRLYSNLGATKKSLLFHLALKKEFNQKLSRRLALKLEGRLSIWQVTVRGNCNTGQLGILFKLQKRCVSIILNMNYKTRSLALFKKLRWSSVNQICLFKRITENMAPEYLINKLATFESVTAYSLRRSLPY